MNQKYKIIIGILIIIALGGVGYAAYLSSKEAKMPIDATPQQVVLSGTYTCLPHIDTKGPQTQECAFGLRTDEGIYYAVNFGASADAMKQFQSGQYIAAEGFVVAKEALSSDQWAKYNMKGIFTITKIIPPPSSGAKLDINVVCQSALTYMTFPDAKSAETFVTECKEGKHPEVIERYKAQMNLGDGATI